MKTQDSIRGFLFVAVVGLLVIIIIWAWNAEILGLNAKTGDPDKIQNIQIVGESGIGYHNIRLEANPSDHDGKYNIFRIIYDRKHTPFDPLKFTTLDEILDNCEFLDRSAPKEYTLIYVDWDVVEGLEDPTKRFVYYVTQDDGQFSNPVKFK